MAKDPTSFDDLRRFDLNLLIAFNILIAERSVTAAARRLGVGQPAMSNALARLRDMLNDPLLTRTPSGMQPTPRALDLVEPISRFLEGLRTDVFTARSFTPAAARQTFRIGISDQTEAALMQDILHAISREAPNVRIIARSIEMHLGAELLATGAIDLAVGYFPKLEEGLETKALYHETFVCLFDAEACGLQPPLSLEDYISLPQILVSLRGEPFGHIDDLLEQARQTRTIIYTTPHFLAVPFLLHGFRAISALPRRLAENCAEAAGLAICPVPLPSTGYDVRMAWHRRTANDPAQSWLRGIVTQIGNSRL